MNATFRKGAVYRFTNRKGFCISEQTLRYLGAEGHKPFEYNGLTKYLFEYADGPLKGLVSQTCLRQWLDKGEVKAEFISYQ